MDLGRETGLTVNGIVAMVDGDQFIANHVPLQEGENTITATATDTQGYTAEASVNVTLEPMDNFVKITADQQSGVSPLEATLSVEGSFGFTESLVTYTGPGTVEFLESDIEEYLVSITGEGIYYFTVQVTDTENNIHTDTVALVVLDQIQLDQLLTAKWNGMKTALNDGDINTALGFIANGAKDMYEYNFNLLNSNLPEISAGLHDISLVRVSDGEAEYNVLGDQGGQTYSFYVLFIKDSDGIWRIRFF